MPHKTPKPAFIVDAMLAELAKWLRILGFYSILIKDFNDVNRFLQENPESHFVTSSKKHFSLFNNFKRILLTTDDLGNQLQTIDEHTGIFSKMDILSICTRCNVPVEPADKAILSNEIPEKVKDSFDHFWMCPFCKRVYWKGGHVERIFVKLKRLHVPIS
jgi:uncharacterized protein with PIN domain